MEHFLWILFAAVGALNVLLLRRRMVSKPLATSDRELAQQATWVYSLLLVLPWLVMGLGMFLGESQHVFEYFMLGEGGLFPMLFWGIPLAVLAYLNFWVRQTDQNAESIARNSTWFSKSPSGASFLSTAKRVRVYFTVMLLGYSIGLALLLVFTSNAPIDLP